MLKNYLIWVRCAANVYMCDPWCACVCEGQRTTLRSQFSCYLAGPRDLIQVVGPVYKHLYSLGHLNSPQTCVLHSSIQRVRYMGQKQLLVIKWKHYWKLL